MSQCILKIGTVYMISYAHTCREFAIIEKLTPKTVLFRIIKYSSDTVSIDGSHCTSILKPLKDKKTSMIKVLHGPLNSIIQRLVQNLILSGMMG